MFDFGYPNADPSERGWGPGWRPGMPIGDRPDSYPGKIVDLVVQGVAFDGGIRSELHDLAALLLEESLRRGHIPRLDDPGCWGGAFRPTKRSDGTFTDVPSNHSWYTALDINAPHNVFGSSEHQIPATMAALWHRYGWRWLGPPISDWMHFDFAGGVKDSKTMTAQALRDLGDVMTPEDAERLKDVEAWQRGFDEAVKGEPAPPKDARQARLRGYKAGTRSLKA